MVLPLKQDLEINIKFISRSQLFCSCSRSSRVLYGNHWQAFVLRVLLVRRGMSTITEERVELLLAINQNVEMENSIPILCMTYPCDHPCMWPVSILKTKPITTFPQRKSSKAGRTNESFPTSSRTAEMVYSNKVSSLTRVPLNWTFIAQPMKVTLIGWAASLGKIL